jgi:hypothetical protein
MEQCMLRKLIVTIALIASAAVARDASALSFSDSVQNWNWGGVGELSLRSTFGGMQVALGAAYGQVAVEDLDANRVVWGFFVDPRLLLKTTPGAAPYIGARVSYLLSSIDVSELGISGITEAKSKGWVFAGEFGVLFPLGAQWAFDAMLTFGVATFGDIDVDGGTTIPDSSDSGTTGSLKIGIVYSFSAY